MKLARLHLEMILNAALFTVYLLSFAHIYSSVKKQILTTILTTIRAGKKIYGLLTTKNVNYRNKTC